MFIFYRKHKVWVKSEDIEIPGGKVEGPDMALENKEFVAFLTINNKEKVGGVLFTIRITPDCVLMFQLNLRCRIHHVGEDSVRNPVWYIKQAEPVWENER